MKLTTEQKINLLILAGFEPMVRSDARQDLRITNRDKMRALTLNEEDARHDWQYDAVDESSFRAYYVPSTWASMIVRYIPDELIYEAIQS